MLAAIAAALPARLTTALAEVDADGGPTLSAPASGNYLVADPPEAGEMQMPRARPMVYLTAGDYDDSQSPQTSRRIVNATLLARAYIAGGKAPSAADSDARYYGLALRHALTRIGLAGGIDGLGYLAPSGEAEIGEISENDNGRYIDVACRVAFDLTEATL